MARSLFSSLEFVSPRSWNTAAFRASRIACHRYSYLRTRRSTRSAAKPVCYFDNFSSATEHFSLSKCPFERCSIIVHSFVDFDRWVEESAKIANALHAAAVTAFPPERVLAYKSPLEQGCSKHREFIHLTSSTSLRADAGARRCPASWNSQPCVLQNDQRVCCESWFVHRIFGTALEPTVMS